MEKAAFKSFCDSEFKNRGFIKMNKGYYLNGDRGVLCAIFLQKSNYGSIYYVNYYFFLGTFYSPKEYPTHYDSDIYSRILAMSKTQTYHGEHFITAMIEYEEYTEDELRPFFDKAFEERILPPVHQGKKYILENLGKLYRLTSKQEEVMRKLQS